MVVEIEYCGACGYERRATALAAHLRAAFNVQVDLKEGSDGAFEIRADGSLVFSKKDLGRFPADQEFVDDLEDLLGWGS